MKEFFAFVRKEFLHIFRDRRTLLVLIGLPAVLIVLFGFAISTEIRNVNIGYMSPDDDVHIDRLMDKICRSDYFTYSGRYLSEREADDAMRRGEADVVLMFGDDFMSRLYSSGGAEVSVVADAVNPNNASMEVMYLTGIITDYFRERQAAGAFCGIGDGSGEYFLIRVGRQDGGGKIFHGKFPLIVRALESCFFELLLRGEILVCKFQ